MNMGGSCGISFFVLYVTLVAPEEKFMVFVREPELNPTITLLPNSH